MHERRYSRAAQAVNLALLLLLFVGSLWVYPSLPNQIPQHTGFDGDVTYWETTLLRWLALPLVSAFLIVFGYGIAYGTARNPQRVLMRDFPDKELYRTLSHWQKRVVTDLFRALSHAMVTPTLIAFTFMQVEFYLLAVASRTETPAFMTWVEYGLMLGGTIGVGLLFHLWISRSIQRLADREA